MAETRAGTDAALDATSWTVGESYDVEDAVDRFVMDPGPVLRLAGEPKYAQPDTRGNWTRLRRGEYKLASGELRVRRIVDTTPELHGPARIWRPSDRAGLSDESAALGAGDAASILAWVRANGFVGVRAARRERGESVEEIGLALRYFAQARAILRAIRELRGAELRAEVERQMNYQPGFLTDVQRDPDHQAMSGTNLARLYGVAVPTDASRKGAGAYIQALYCLSYVLAGPMQRLLKVSAHVAPTENGMRLQGSILAVGPLATAYQKTLDEAKAGRPSPLSDRCYRSAGGRRGPAVTAATRSDQSGAASAGAGSVAAGPTAQTGGGRGRPPRGPNRPAPSPPDRRLRRLPYPTCLTGRPYPLAAGRSFGRPAPRDRTRGATGRLGWTRPGGPPGGG